MLIPLLILAACAPPQEATTISRHAPQAQNPQGQTLVFYDVRDLAASFWYDAGAREPGATWRPTREQRVIPAKLGYKEQPVEPEQVSGPEATPEQLESGGRWLAEIISTFVEPPFSDPTEQARCTRDATLVVSARPVQHEWVKSYLNGLRTFDTMIALETTLYTAPRGVLRKWDIAPSATLASPEELSTFRERVDADGRFEVVNAPKLLQLPARQATIAIGEEVAYIKSWQVRIVEPGGQEIADPEIETVWEGLLIEGRTSPLPWKRFGLQLELESCEIERPIPTRKVRISASTDQEVEIGEPEVKTARFAATVVLADGASAVLVTADTDPEKDLAVVVTVRRVGKPEDPSGK